MNDLQTMLTGADPVAHDPELPADDALAMRRVVLSAARVQRPAAEPLSGFVPIAAVVIVTVAAGVALGRKLPDRGDAAARSGVAVQPPAERRQVQFATPGGTRIIWTLDPEFQLRGLTP
jgi:hypothetical protein